MKIRPTPILAGSVLALLLSLAACGKKKADDTAEDDGPQSTQGAILESVKKTADEANERSRKVKEQMDKARE